MTASDIMAIMSASCFTVGTFFLAGAIEFQADKIKLGDSKSDKNVREMGSPGRIVWWKLRWGQVLTGLGLAFFVLSFAFR